MITSRVLGAVGKAVDWSLIHVLAAISDRVEGRGADCYRRADALADMEAGADHLEPGDVGSESPKWLRDMVDAAEKWNDENTPYVPHVKCRAGHRYFDSFICTKPYGHLGTHGYAGSFWEDFEATDPDDRFAPQAALGGGTTPAADNTTAVDHLEAAWNYHQPAPGYSTTRNATIWHCEGCNWNGPTPQAHARHRFQVLADMTAATGRVQQKLGGAG